MGVGGSGVENVSVAVLESYHPMGPGHQNLFSRPRAVVRRAGGPGACSRAQFRRRHWAPRTQLEPRALPLYAPDKLMSHLYEFLYERTALEALPLLEAAGIETLEDLQLLNADDLAALGIEESTCAHILGVQYTASQRAQQQAVSEERSQPKQSSEATSSSSSSEIIEWLTLAGIPHAEPMLSAQGIERTSDLAMLTVQDVDALNLPDGIGPRLKWALR